MSKTEFKLVRSSVRIGHDITIDAEEFLSLSIEGLTQLRHNIRKAIKASDKRDTKKLHKEIARFLAESCTEDKIRAVSEKPHIAIIIPGNQFNEHFMGFKFAEDGSFIPNPHKGE